MSRDDEIDIPEDPSGVDRQWVLALLRHLHENEDVDENAVIDLSVHGADGGVLSDIVRGYVRAAKKNKKFLVLNIFVKLMPSGFMPMVNKHDLFAREITFYRSVLPTLRNFLSTRAPSLRLEHFQVPKFLYGSASGDKGILVLEDISTKGFTLFDQTMTLLDYEHMKAAVRALAEFHALGLSYDLLEKETLNELYPIFSADTLMWMQNDMLQFLEGMTKAAKEFLDSIPGEQETSKRFYSKMCDPLRLFKEELSRQTPFRCLQHGDSWHNNFMFRKSRNSVKVSIVDWQVCYYGSCVSDLCYLLYSSSTSLFRRIHMDDLLKQYYEILTSITRSLGVTQELFNPTFQLFEEEFQKALSLCLLFCGSAEDLRLDQDPQSDSAYPCDDVLASDKEVRDLSDPYRRNPITPEKARALRRKNYLDICREAVRKGVV